MSNKRHDRELFANALKQVQLNESKIELNSKGDIVFNNKQPINELLGSVIAGGLLLGLGALKGRQIYMASQAAQKKAAAEADEKALNKQNLLSSIAEREAAAQHRTDALNQQRKEAAKNRRADRRARGSNRKQATTIAQNANNAALDAARIKAAAVLAAAGHTPPPPPTP